MGPLWLRAGAALSVAVLVLAGGFLEFARYYLKGMRSGNSSYLLAAAGLLSLFACIASEPAMRPVLAVFEQSWFRRSSLVAGGCLLFAALALFLYLTYLKPSRLRFEDELMDDLQTRPPSD